MKFTEAQARYSVWVKDQGLAQRTIKESLRSLRRFGAYVKRRGIETVEGVTRREVDDYKTQMRQWKSLLTSRPLSARTTELYLGSVKSFFAWVVTNGWTSLNPATDILSGIPQRNPRSQVLTAEEMTQILARPDGATAIGRRDRLILELMYSTGICIKEIVGLDLSDIDLEKNLLHVKGFARGRERWIPLTEDLCERMKDYLKEIRPVWARPMKHGKLPSGALFYSPCQRPLPFHALHEMVGAHVRAVRGGVASAGESIRQACAARRFECGATIAEVHALLGHVQMRQTVAYTRVGARCS
jgi:site-specific recombinase XerD